MTKTLDSFTFDISRKEASFDRACDAARDYVLAFMDIDEDGNSPKEYWCRSTDYIRIDFVSLTVVGGFMGWDCCYRFQCFIEREEENDANS